MDVYKLLEDRAQATMDIIKEANSRGDSEVKKFYDGAVVFLTGGSGFLGKQLIEKLIRSTNVNKIYVMLRPKKGKTIQERLKKILEDPVYEDIYNVKPSFVDKVIPIEGDVADINFGMDKKTWSNLSNEINVIIHAAATTNFVEKLKIATLTNIRGTREMLKLAGACRHLKSIVQVSTAYSQATKSRCGMEVKEKFYESPISPDALIELSESLDEDILNSAISPLLHEWPNTYTFTKAVSEELVRRQAGDLPICIVRPAVVIGAYVEPKLGWIDSLNIYGASGVVAGVSLGILHILWGREDKNFDCVPVDYVNNAIIVAASKTFSRYRDDDKRTVVYTVTDTRNPFKTGDLFNLLSNEGSQFIASTSIWYSFLITTQYKLIYLILTWLLHFIPALLIDGCCILIGKKPRLFKIYKTANRMTAGFRYFGSNEWTFHDANTLELYNQLPETDKQLYNFDMSSVNTKEMLWSWCYGVRKYIVKDNMNNTEYVRKKQFWFKIAHYIIFPLYIYLLYTLAYLTFVVLCSGYSVVRSFVLLVDRINLGM